MIERRKRTLLGSFLASFLSLFGCGQTGSPPKDDAPVAAAIETLTVHGFDPDGEPVITRWSDGSVRVRFEAMPPFFAEDEGTEAEFEDFERIMSAELGVPVRRDDREDFVIPNAPPNTAAELKAWLEAYHGARTSDRPEGTGAGN